MWFLILLLTLFVDSIVYTVPILIYRFCVREGEPIENKKKATLINFAFYAVGIVALVIINRALSAYEDENYHFQLGLIDGAFWIIDFFILTYGKKTETNNSSPVQYNQTRVEGPIPYIKVTKDTDEDTHNKQAPPAECSYKPIYAPAPPPEPSIEDTFDVRYEKMLEKVNSIRTPSIPFVEAELQVAVYVYVCLDYALLSKPDREEISKKLWDHIDDKLKITSSGMDNEFWACVGEYAKIINGAPVRQDWNIGSVQLSPNGISEKILFAFGDMLINPGCRSDYANAPIVLYSFDALVEFELTFMSKILGYSYGSGIRVDSMGNIVPSEESTHKIPGAMKQATVDPEYEQHESGWSVDKYNVIVVIFMVIVLVLVIIYALSMRL